MTGWFETNATAGAKSKGEVRLKHKGTIEVKDTGDFRFTKMPEFDGASVFTNYDWQENIGLVEGISWEHGAERKTKWRAQFPIPKADLTKWCNLYTDAGTKGWKDDEFIKIDFLCIRPCLEYNYNGKTYRYQWETFCYETPYLGDEALLWTTININNSADVAKIKGTWTGKYEWDETEHFLAKVHVVENETLIIAGDTVKHNYLYTYTKLDGGTFTETEAKDLVDDLNSYKLSEDRQTIIETYENEGTSLLSECFANFYDEKDRGTGHFDLKLFKDKSALKIICSGTNSEGNYSYYEIYKKQ